MSMMTEETPKAEEISAESISPTPVSPIEETEKVVESSAEIELSSPTEALLSPDDKTVDYPMLEDGHSKEHLHSFFGKLKDLVQHHAGPAVYKKVDELIKEAKESWDNIKQADRQAALESFKAANEGSEEGFTYKGDSLAQEIDSAIHTIKKTKQDFFQQLEKVREKALEGKTRLINELRTLVDADDNSDPAHVNASFKAFKKIQDEWKTLGSVQGPMNQTLWQSYHALVDRFYSNRSIFFELLELDRKKNLQAKETIAVKLESLAEMVKQNVPLQKLMKDAEELFEEYKHIGPTHRDENEALWQRVKKSLDVLFEQKRQVNEAQKAGYEENLKIKKELADLMHHHATFQSGSIAEWNQSSKAVLALQEQWGKLKGGLPREGGKEVSHQFWSDLKLFFKHKSEFFAKIDAERKANLTAKLLLIEQVEGIVAVGTETQEITQQVIELQKKWKEIGHVPEKQKDQIYTKFKAACDAYFNLKRSKGKGAQDEEFEANLVAKQAILAELEATLKDPSLLANLKAKKEAWDAIGFVPRKNVKEIQEKFRTTWNSVIDLARTQPKEQLAAWGFELKSLPAESGGGSDERRSHSGDSRKKIQALENDIAVLTNNLEFFAKSKGADKLRAEVEKKIEQAQKELEKLKKD